MTCKQRLVPILTWKKARADWGTRRVGGGGGGVGGTLKREGMCVHT